ncbi:Phosphate transporter 33 [Heracleum sosnowskyi]|uniref:Phosphate transporter 33 n=1 Tax=Heracleum sosnowskyi TaxID=360622 RepID=A0AAD8HQA8_9APIA|nr:Phosphate transporter 33 [Heracleum sosnowskyi]
MKEGAAQKSRKSVEEEWKRIDYYKICTLGGMLSAGTTHLLITPLDVLKVNMQVNPVKYNHMTSSFSILWKEQGPSAFGRAVKVCVQTQPTFAKGLVDGFPKLYASRGISGLYKGLFPLWGRNLPFSMIMFSTFEHSVDMLYGNVIQRRKEDCSRAQQLGVTSLAGFVAGAVGTVISNPADNIVSSLYNKKADSVRQAIKNIGFVNLFTRSLPVRLMIVGPVVTLQWFLYDTIKVLSGLPTSGGLNSHAEETTQLTRKHQQIA